MTDRRKRAFSEGKTRITLPESKREERLARDAAAAAAEARWRWAPRPSAVKAIVAVVVAAAAAACRFRQLECAKEEYGRPGREERQWVLRTGRMVAAAMIFRLPP